MSRALLLFKSTRDAIKAERILKARHKKIKVIPVPRTISSECGIALELLQEEPDHLRDILEHENIAVTVRLD